MGGGGGATNLSITGIFYVFFGRECVEVTFPLLIFSILFVQSETWSKIQKLDQAHTFFYKREKKCQGG